MSLGGGNAVSQKGLCLRLLRGSAYFKFDSTHCRRPPIAWAVASRDDAVLTEELKTS